MTSRTQYILRHAPSILNPSKLHMCFCPSAAAAGYLLIPVIAVVLGLSNLFGYFKCSKDAKKQLQSMTANMATNAMTSALTGRLQAAFARV